MRLAFELVGRTRTHGKAMGSYTALRLPEELASQAPFAG
jgi:hypothetical protein